tara:strand:- start:2977 stop:3288 length:312 start_codon:yes stop_codon:yes gene_type:complete
LAATIWGQLFRKYRLHSFSISPFKWGLTIIEAITLFHENLVYAMPEKRIPDSIKYELKKEVKLMARIIVVSFISLAFYYLISPYQNCMREGMLTTFCFAQTSW